MPELSPIFLKLGGCRALVVGGGKMAALRVMQLIKAGARSLSLGRRPALQLPAG